MANEAMMKQYRDLKAKHPEAMLLFRCGDFYETYEDDARECAKVLGITLTFRNGDKMPMAGFPHHALDTYLPKLVRAANSGQMKFKRIAICDQLDPPPGPKRKRGTTTETTEDNNNSNNNQNNSVMATKKNNQKNETKNAANEQPVINQVDVMGLMGALKKNGTAKLSDHFIKDEPIEDAKAEEVVENVAVGEATIDNIMPKMTAEPEEPVKVEGSEYQVSDGKGGNVTFESVIPGAIAKAANEGTATTMPLGQHGTLVIASGGGEKSKPTEKPNVTLRKKTKQAEPDGKKADGGSQKAEETKGDGVEVKLAGLTRVRLFEYTTSHNEKALGIAGFSGEDDPRWKPIRDERRRLAAEYKKAKAKDPKAKAKSHPIYLSRMMDPATGGWCNTMLLGPRYMDVAKQLCKAYNTDDREAWAKAVQVVKDCKTAISNGFQAERTARRAARKAEHEAQNAQPSAVSHQPSQGKTYTAAEMEALVRAMAQAMATAQGADVKQFEPLVQAAMKKAA